MALQAVMPGGPRGTGDADFKAQLWKEQAAEDLAVLMAESAAAGRGYAKMMHRWRLEREHGDWPGASYATRFAERK